MEVESLEKRDTGLDSRRLQKSKKADLLPNEAEIVDSRKEILQEHDDARTGEPTRLGFAQLDSSAFTFATRNSSRGGGVGWGGLLLAPGRLSVGQGVERSRRGTSHETVRE